METIKLDEVKEIICRKIKNFSEIALENKHDFSATHVCSCYILEDIGLLREFNIISSDVYDNLSNKALKNDFEYLAKVKIEDSGKTKAINWLYDVVWEQEWLNYVE